MGDKGLTRQIRCILELLCFPVFCQVVKFKFDSQEISQSSSSTHGTNKHKPTSLVENIHVEAKTKIPRLKNKTKQTNKTQ